MDKIFIHQLTVPAVIGVLPSEQTQTQSLSIDLEVTTDIRPAAASDDLSLTADYAAMRQTIIQHVQTTHYQLIETLAEKLASLLLQTYRIVGVVLKITKQPADMADTAGVGVVIERAINSDRNPH